MNNFEYLTLKPETMSMDAFHKIVERVEEINEIIKLSYKENRLDVVDTLIDELKDIEARLNYKGYLC